MADDSAEDKIERMIQTFRAAGGNLLDWLTHSERMSVPKPKRYLFGLIRIGPSERELEEWASDIACRAYFEALEEAKDQVRVKDQPAPLPPPATPIRKRATRI